MQSWIPKVRIGRGRCHCLPTTYADLGGCGNHFCSFIKSTAAKIAAVDIFYLAVWAFAWSIKALACSCLSLSSSLSPHFRGTSAPCGDTLT